MHQKSFVDCIWAPPGSGGGAYSAPPHPLAGFKGPTSKGGRREIVGRERERGGEGKGGRGKEGREGGKENGGDGRKRDLPDQCEIASYVPIITVLRYQRAAKSLNTALLIK